MKYFDKKTLNDLHNDIQKAMDAIADKYEIERIVVGSKGNFSPLFFQKVLDIQVGNRLDVKNTVNKYVESQPDSERARDILEMSIAGIPADIIGQKFSTYGSEVIIFGFDSRAKKYPLLGVVTSSGKAYKYSLDYILEK
jgi:hypothetical protein